MRILSCFAIIYCGRVMTIRGLNSLKTILVSMLWVFCIVGSGIFMYWGMSGLLFPEYYVAANQEESQSILVHTNLTLENQEEKQREVPNTNTSSLSSPEVNAEYIPMKGYFLFIDLDRKQMEVYRDGKIIKMYPVSGGKKSTPSPEGNWKVISKDTWGEGFGGAWLGFNVPWGKYGIHGTIYPWLIGKSNASKGCIRMKNKDVVELYQYIPHGTKVRIIQHSYPFRTMKNGDIGSDIKQIQGWLKRLGYYKGSEDGRFGTYLQLAVQTFQKEMHMSVNGVVDTETYERMKLELESLGDS